MKIYLFLKTRIITFSLPKDILGSFSFDENINEEDKLINVEARNNEWVLYSTSDVTIETNNGSIDYLRLSDNTFYILKRNEISYLIYASDTSKNKLILYSYDQNIDLKISNSDDATLQYNCPFLNKTTLKIKSNNGVLTIENDQAIFYVNNINLGINNYNIKIGDQINIYGLKLIFLKDLIIINNPGDLVILKQNTNLHPYLLPSDDIPKDILIKETELYSKNDFFSKSPRIRRNTTTKKIKLSEPPQRPKADDLPTILTIGPMMTMGISSAMMVVDTLNKINTGQTTMKDSWTSLITSAVMLFAMIFWPLVTRSYNNRKKTKLNREIIYKYSLYLDEKRRELSDEQKLQKDILLENMLSIDDCLNTIKSKSMNFWNKRLDQSDFLTARIGVGDQPLDIEIEYPEEGFSLEDDKLKNKADELINEFKYIKNVPIGYSFYNNRLTAVMGGKIQGANFVNNILLQFLTYYSYEDLKIVVFTNENNFQSWEYLKYTNHNFNNERDFRFFSSTQESASKLSEYLMNIINTRMDQKDDSAQEIKMFSPYYLIIVDDYERIKEYEFINILSENEKNLGFSMIMIAQRLSNLPSKCNNYIDLQNGKSGILKNDYDKQEYILFNDEINNNIDYMEVSRMISNIPIEFEEKIGALPNAISFMEMEKVGKVEQLNILNRWNTNDSTKSLKSEIGVNERNELMYLDLHEKYHGPHGLIAGTTGSGKSEFIITYILSMCINYSPDDIAFILIDYKGGGLALAFENKLTGIRLPHLAGTITDLDKAEMDRTLVSIDSEVNRRKKMFNEARDLLGESTIDIYKYQKHYKEGHLKEPIPHLFIICDEFAELKSQQPEFMDNLISIARIGRSLGVHLILATQKPSGVVNDQIWSNSKFKICLKVQDESDSNEMLKHPDAAHLTQAGRFYLQVGYDEIYELGQSGWAGAKYYPSDKIVKTVDKSISYINDCAEVIKNAEENDGVKIEAQGEQIAAIMKKIIEIADNQNKRAKKLWLDNIPPIILLDDLYKKYNIQDIPYKLETVIGEYDAPENQEQGLVKYNYLEDGNTLIYGTDSNEKEMFLNALIYGTAKNHSSDEINFYIIDYGSEFSRKFISLPHVGGTVYADEDDKSDSLLKLIANETGRRKRLLVEYNSIESYNKNTESKLPLIVVIINNYESYYEAHPELYDIFPEFVRDSVRYGIIFIMTCTATNAVANKISQNFTKLFAYKLKEKTEYGYLFDSKVKVYPRNVNGRGIVDANGVHEFQTISITPNESEFNDFIKNFINDVKAKNPHVAPPIPTLPNIIRMKDIEKNISDLTNVPIGINKKDVEIATFNFIENSNGLITSLKLKNMNNFILSFLQVLNKIPNINTIIFDAENKLQLNKEEYVNYYNENISEIIGKINEYIDKLIETKASTNSIIIIYGLISFGSSVKDTSTITSLFNKVKEYGHIGIVGVDDVNNIKSILYDDWFSNNFNNESGIWIGKGCGDQNILKVNNFSKELQEQYNNDMGFEIIEGETTLVKFIDFFSEEEEDK